MLIRLFLLFTLVPLLELYILIKIGNAIGALNTIILVLVTGVLGVVLARMEGIRTFRQISRNLSQGVLPAEELVDGLLIFVAGTLLITPGVVTDLIGFFLLVPVTRTMFKRWLRRRFDAMVASRNLRIHFRDPFLLL